MEFSRSIWSHRREKPSQYVLPPVCTSRTIATGKYGGAAPRIHCSSSTVSIRLEGRCRRSSKCFTPAAGLLAMYLRFTANSNMHCKYSSARLTVAPLTGQVRGMSADFLWKGSQRRGSGRGRSDLEFTREVSAKCSGYVLKEWECQHG